jgi:4a-hydroxytetrahydrobiopterin dehydratase
VVGRGARTTTPTTTPTTTRMTGPTTTGAAFMAEAEELHRRSPTELPKGTPTLTDDQAAALDGQLSPSWRRDGTTALHGSFEFKNFAQAFAFTTEVALLAERYFHHPDIEVGWGYTRLTFTTHSIGGLSDNDYIMAAKIDRFE